MLHILLGLRVTPDRKFVPMDKKSLPTDKTCITIDQKSVTIDRKSVPMDKMCDPTDKKFVPADKQVVTTDNSHRCITPLIWRVTDAVMGSCTESPRSLHCLQLKCIW